MAASRATNRPPVGVSATRKRVRAGGVEGSGGSTTGGHSPLFEQRDALASSASTPPSAGERTKPSKSKKNARKTTVVGRPKVLWTHSQQRRLLRLYLFTPPSELPLSSILALLTEANFIPRERRTQTELRKLLADDKYWRLRPKDRDCMRRRLEFLRAARIEAQKRRKAGKGRPIAIDLIRPGSTDVSNSRHRPTASTEYPWTPELLSHETFNQLPLAFDLADAPDSLADHTYLGASMDFGSGGGPRSVRSSTSTDTDATPTGRSRTARVSFLKRILPNRTPSFIADVASLFSGLSHKSVSSGSTKRNSGSSYPSDAASARHWAGYRSSVTPTPDLLSPPPEDEEQDFTNIPMVDATPESSHDKNAAVIAACCDNRTQMMAMDPAVPMCVHQRLIQAINMVKEQPNDMVEFVVTRDEADVPDALGNILLHVAAIWGAPIPILRAIMKETTNVSAKNLQGETFLHVYSPSTDLPPTPHDFGNLTRALRKSKFNFRQLDSLQRTCLNRLILNPAFSLEALDAFFSEVSETTGVWLVSNRSVKGERLFHCFCRKLYNLNMEIPDSSNDEFLYRQHNYLQRFASGRTFETRLGPPPTSSTSFPPPATSERRQNNVSPNTPPSASSDQGSPSPSRSPLSKLDRESDLEKIVNHLLNGHYDVNEHEEQTGRTRLMILLQALGSATIQQHQQHQQQHLQQGVPDALIRKLIASGCRLDETDKMGNTALHYAAELGLPAVAGLLCLFKADVNAINRCGETPLDLARSGIFRRDTLGGIRKWTRFLECGSILMHHTDATVKTVQGLSPAATDSSRGSRSPMTGGSPMSRSDDSVVMAV